MTRLSKNLPALLLSTVLSACVLELYAFEPVLLSLVLMGIGFLAYSFFDSVFSIKKFGDAIFILFEAIILFMVYMLVMGRGELNDLITYLLKPGKAGFAFDSYIFVLCVMLLSIVFVIVYYFTVVQYRGYVLFFTAMIPVVLYFKAKTPISLMHIFAVSLVLFYAVSFYSGSRFLKADNSILSRAEMKKVLLLALSAFILTFTLPMSEEPMFKAAVKQKMSKYSFMRLQQDSDALGYFQDESLDRPGEMGLGEDRLLYTLFCEEPVYLQRSSFTKYVGDGWLHEPEKSYNVCYKEWKENERLQTTQNLRRILKPALEEYPQLCREYGITPELLPTTNDVYSTFNVQTNSFFAYFILTTSRTIGHMNVGMDTYRSKAGRTALKSGRPLSPIKSYTVEYYKDDLLTAEREDVLRFASAISLEDYISLLYDVSTLYERGTEEFRICEAFILSAEAALEIRNEPEYEYKNCPRLYDLADEICRDCETPFEKAEKLASYFRDNDYTYDINYAPDEAIDTVEYFVFNSKRGSCSDFATAMTLMAQHVGLPVLYTEGFYPIEKSENSNVYDVTANSSHAYVRLYVQGYGWCVLEPTVGMDEDSWEEMISQIQPEEGEAGNADMDNFLKKLIIAMTALLLAIVIFVLFKRILCPVLGEVFFNLRYKLSTPSRAVSLLYLKCFSLMRADKDTTPKELEQKALDEYGFDLSELVDLFEAGFYGNKQISAEHKESLSGVYKGLKRATGKKN